MAKVYLQRDYGNGETYVTFDIPENHFAGYSIEQRNIDCKRCNKKQSIICSTKFSQDFCPNCHDIAMKKLLAAMMPNRSRVPGSKKIPSWRLDLDDATPEAILNRSQGDFKMPSMSKAKWEEFYSQPHELAKQREAEKQRREESRELLKSLG